MVVLSGLWLVVWSWHGRMVRTHIVAVTMVLWGLGLLAAQILPRVGYARVDPANPPGWLCSAPSGTSVLGRLIPGE